LHAHIADNLSLIDATVVAQPYVFVIEAEDRILLVSPESRVLQIIDEDRTNKPLNN